MLLCESRASTWGTRQQHKLLRAKVLKQRVANASLCSVETTASVCLPAMPVMPV